MLLVRIVLLIGCVKPTFLKVLSFISAISVVTRLILNATGQINYNVKNATNMSKKTGDGLV